jgi:hypothetical protein
MRTYQNPGAFPLFHSRPRSHDATFGTSVPSRFSTRLEPMRIRGGGMSGQRYIPIPAFGGVYPSFLPLRFKNSPFARIFIGQSTHIFFILNLGISTWGREGVSLVPISGFAGGICDPSAWIALGTSLL